ncbi:immunoglobulin G-binding protein A-like [Melanerpes formicivorus]|uniref:immunoglobulin G-binding protein A-like n=1 Tax=Melanerpes formicivorus TaxID=211600 RepID=UPI00358F19D1
MFSGCGGRYSSGSFSQRGKKPGKEEKPGKEQQPGKEEKPGKEQQPGKEPGGGDKCGGSNVTVSGPLENTNYIFKVEGDGVGNISISGRPKQQDKGEGSHSSGSSSQHDKQPGKESEGCNVDVRQQVSNKNRMGAVRGNNVGNISISG